MELRRVPRNSRRRRPRRRFFEFKLSLCVVLLSLLCSLYTFPIWAEANDDDYYNDDDAAAAGDDAAAAADDAVAAADDDDAAAAGDDAAQQVDDDGNQAAGNGFDYEKDDDSFVWDESREWNTVSVMPVSCLNYNNGHMIKFDFFDSQSSYQCHRSMVGSFVVSIAHYMRAYFNNQALIFGADFNLPGDAGYLNCVLLQETAYAEIKLYAKIGCTQRETFTSTKLQLHVYTDNLCSIPFDDGQSDKRHSSKGYEINGYLFSTRVSFRPPFYSCLNCVPEEVSETFNKKSGNWYDDDYIAQYGRKQNDDDQGNQGDDYLNDDTYLYSNDDVNRDDDARYYGANDDANDDAGDDGNAAAADDYNDAVYADDAAQNQDDDDANAQGDDFKNDDVNGAYNFDDDYYADDDAGRRLGELPVRTFTAAAGELEKFEHEFWEPLRSDRSEQSDRSLYDNYYDIGDWNMCQRIYKYGLLCDSDCQALDAFRVDEWSKADVFLLVIMCVFVAAMMLLVVAKRLKAAQKARLYGDENYKPGLPPFGMALIFILIMTTIVVLAKLKFVNETLVFAVLTCILLFIYMLKLTLFESRRPVLLAAPKHDLFDNPLDDKLFS